MPLGNSYRKCSAKFRNNLGFIEQCLGGDMRTLDKQGVVTMQELLVSSLATADAVAKLLINKGLITEAIGREGGVSGDVAEDELGKMAAPRKRIGYLPFS